MVAGGLLVASVAAASVAYGQNQYEMMAPGALMQAWMSGNPADKPAIAQALIDNRAASTAALRDAVISGDAATRAFACSMLAELRDVDSVPALLTASGDQDERVQGRAVSALRDIGDPRALPRLRELLQTAPSPGVLKRALAGIGKLGTAGDRGLVRPLLAHPDEGVRVMAAGALAMLGSAGGQDVLLDATERDDPGAQKNATYALGFLGTPEATARLNEILADPNGQWKSYAVMALAQHERASQSPPQQAATLERLARGRDRLVAGWALDELTDLPVPEAVQVIQQLASGKGVLGEKARFRLKVREGR
jgi:HEAT repeat protein